MEVPIIPLSPDDTLPVSSYRLILGVITVAIGMINGLIACQISVWFSVSFTCHSLMLNALIFPVCCHK